jgi:transcriptional antiterminator NusG
MKKEWFVLQTLTGQENKVQTNIRCRVGQEQMGDYVGQCIIPMEKVTESKNGKKRTINKKVFPGYVLVELALYDEAAGLDKDGKRVVVERTWQFLRATPGIIGSWLMQRPNPLTQAEVDAILSTKPTSSSEKPRPKVNFSVGETVKINDGAFMGLTGQISMVDPDRGKLKVEVSVFSRTVPVDVDYWQVEKVEAKAADAIEPAKS